MPVDWSKYPKDWKEISLRIKTLADWKCEHCSKQCRRPGEKFDTHKRTLTTAHMNHKPMDCRDENLKALCAPCHLRYNAKHRAKNAKKTKIKRGIWKNESIKL